MTPPIGTELKQVVVTKDGTKVYVFKHDKTAAFGTEILELRAEMTADDGRVATTRAFIDPYFAAGFDDAVVFACEYAAKSLRRFVGRE